MGIEFIPDKSTKMNCLKTGKIKPKEEITPLWALALSGILLGLITILLYLLIF